ncbi:hypothetical protein [Alcanivorax sp. 1008]|uniref:hypothetical protein n=1 Tax=Alcanivorax sp. 1008 TaxID=2816853 RepID=UPI001D639C59|nr:hypothetical protein [Alcanivorax sp. 1008]MCC1496383.1 hypothetical protein [Alcanivorax sp. 1008]
MKHLQKLLGGSALLASAALIPSLAFATAANTTITNTVTVNYSDAADNAQPAETASVEIDVNLVASIPLVSSPADVDPTTEDTVVSLVYTVTSTANGPDTYNFTSADTRTNMDADAVGDDPSIDLGATTVASAISATDTDIIVPFDGTDDGIVNGLAVGDTIVIDPTGTAEVAVIDSIDETTGAATNTVTITLTAGTTNGFIYGTTIGQRDTVTVDITTDTITAGTSGTHSILSTATSDFDGAVSGTQLTATVITVRRPVLTVTKYVRNATPLTTFNPVAADITVDGVDYYSSGVTGNPGDTMQYLIVIDNRAAGAGTANNIVVSDPIPQFTTFVASSIELDPGDGTFVAQDETADDGDAAELDTTGNGTVYVYAGAGGDDTTGGAGNGDGGTLLATEISHVIFQVTID